MSAGTQTDHFHQIAGETYAVAYLCQLAINSGRSLKNDATEEHDAFVQYCAQRDALDSFVKSKYKAHLDAALPSVFQDICDRLPDEQFWFEEVKHELRAVGQKGDFILHSNSERRSVSLKGYKKGFDSIQVFSGTAQSFLAPFVMKKTGVGTVIHPITGEKFHPTRNPDIRDAAYQALGYPELVEISAQIREIHDTIVERYGKNEASKFWADIYEQLAEDRIVFGHQMVDLLIKGLNVIPTETIKMRILEAAGLNDGAEEVLLIGPGKYFFSLGHPQWRTMISRLNSSDAKISYTKNHKSLDFAFVDKKGEIITVCVPVTLNTNGCWAWSPSVEGLLGKHKKPELNYFSGKRWYETNKGDAGWYAWGERRRSKSNEFATSINTNLKLKKAGIQGQTPYIDIPGGLSLKVDGIEKLVVSQRSHRTKRTTAATTRRREPSTNSRALAVYQEHHKKGRQAVLKIMVEELGIKKSTASTYYWKAQRAAKGN